MKARIAAHNLVVLTPEGDAEFALMRFWSQMELRKASHVYQFGPRDGDGKVTSLAISFHEIQQAEGKADQSDNSIEEREE